MQTSLRRPEAPRRMETADFGHPNRRATRAISSALALPSTGGDTSRACQGAPGVRGSSSELARALGLTLT